MSVVLAVSLGVLLQYLCNSLLAYLLFLLPLCLNLINISAPQVTLPEHTPPGIAVVTVTATDRDSGENGKITYRVMSSTQEGFYIDPNNGKQPWLPS